MIKAVPVWNFFLESNRAGVLFQCSAGIGAKTTEKEK